MPADGEGKPVRVSDEHGDWEYHLSGPESSFKPQDPTLAQELAAASCICSHKWPPPSLDPDCPLHGEG